MTDYLDLHRIDEKLIEYAGQYNNIDKVKQYVEKGATNIYKAYFDAIAFENVEISEYLLHILTVKYNDWYKLVAGSVIMCFNTSHNLSQIFGFKTKCNYKQN